MRWSGRELGWMFLLLVGGCVQAAPEPDPSSLRVGLETIATGFVSPVDLAAAPDASGRLFVVDQVGLVHVLEADGTVAPTPFLDLTDAMVSFRTFHEERGLLGMGFHPAYADNGRFFVYYTVGDDREDDDVGGSVNRLSEFRVSTDPLRADRDSERVLLEIRTSGVNHNGGALAFGPDGYLYVGVGNGSGGPSNVIGDAPELGGSQDKSTLLGKILRIDVDSGEPYGVPEDNPFVGDPACRAEIWALGLRHPWRLSFDSAADRRLFVGDVGEGSYEEINIVQAGGNYGWDMREGPDAVAESSDDSAVDPGGSFIDPHIAYPHVDAQGEPIGVAVIGGYVYRGSAIPELFGRYVFGDWTRRIVVRDGPLFFATETEDGTWERATLTVAGRSNGRTGLYVLAFGQDRDGELYVLTSMNLAPSGETGAVHKIVPATK